jgi:hypothetical protein
METRSRKRWVQYRDSITGHYCSVEHARLNPDTTQSIARDTEPEQAGPVSGPNDGEPKK